MNSNRHTKSAPKHSELTANNRQIPSVERGLLLRDSPTLPLACRPAVAPSSVPATQMEWQVPP